MKIELFHRNGFVDDAFIYQQGFSLSQFRFLKGKEFEKESNIMFLFTH